MVAIQRILCPIDLSEASAQSLDYAMALAGWYESRVTILHIIDASVASRLPDGPNVAPVIADDVRRFCEPWMKSVSTVEIVVDVGDAAREIASRAERLPADFLVLGTHGRTGFERLWLGSVSEKVLRKVQCPVLTVSPNATTVAKGPVFKTVLCAIDFSDSSLRALEYALSLAEENLSRLILLHVVEPLAELGLKDESAAFAVPEYEQLVAEDAAKRLAALIPEEASAWCQPQAMVAKGKPHREILRVAHETSCELIVMGVHGRGAIDLALFGSTTHHVIRSGHALVLTLRAGGAGH
jgi:nucleotide-binding universal stress UspA family protein